MTEARLVEPLTGPVDAEVHVPGSKSHTNRALLCAALAAGNSALGGVLRADDTEVMLEAVARLGAEVVMHGEVVTIHGHGGTNDGAASTFDVGLSGTTSRFLAPVLAWRAKGDVLDGEPPLRARPMGPGLDALRALGAEVVELGEAECLPVRFDQGRFTGGEVEISGDVSSQFLSGLLLVAPLLTDGITITLTTELVSKPYVDLTVRTMADFGATVVVDGRVYRVGPGGYQPFDGVYELEPDASTASYFFAAAAIANGSITVPGLTSTSVQGDMAFADILERMGAQVSRSETATTVLGTGSLRGIEVDMRDCSDTAQTLAAVAVFADGPTSVTGIGFIRKKETDRIGNVVAELRRCGIEAHEHDDGFTIVPGHPVPATVQTYDDHRMAMSFALLGLRADGIRIADPGCVSKTFPGFWEAIDGLRS